jgi:hypothetical protein
MSSAYSLAFQQSPPDTFYSGFSGCSPFILLLGYLSLLPTVCGIESGQAFIATIIT